MKRKIRKSTEKGTGKYGIIHGSKAGHSYIVEVEEIIKADNMSKVNILEINMNSELWKDDVKEVWGKQRWIETSRIKWYDDNSQKRRDRRLKEVLT